MGRYYFNLRDHVGVDDSEGLEFATVEAAKTYARRIALDQAALLAKEEGELDLADHIEVRNAAGSIVTRIYFGDVLKISIAGRPIA